MDVEDRTNHHESNSYAQHQQPTQHPHEQPDLHAPPSSIPPQSRTSPEPPPNQSSNPLLPMAQLTQDQQQRLELLELEEKRLQNAVRHLIRSNEELQAADVAEPDPVYREALMENQVVVQSLREKIALLQAEIAEIKGRDSGMEVRRGEVGRGDCEGVVGEVEGGAAANSAPATAAVDETELDNGWL
ncbi:unnamed protein product [Closterium sp. NIES-53]